MDCLDGSDEMGCGSGRDPAFQCCDGTRVPAGKQCDGVADCPDRSDEFYCAREREKNFVLLQPALVRMAFLFLFSPPFAVPPCGADEFACSDGRCLSLTLRCNGYPDCLDNSDEACGCENYCQGPGYFLCQDNYCVRAETASGPMLVGDVVCDGVFQCKDGSDEYNCYAGRN